MFGRAVDLELFGCDRIGFVESLPLLPLNLCNSNSYTVLFNRYIRILMIAIVMVYESIVK